MRNEPIRQKAREANVRHWQIADAMGISESQLSRMFRYEMSEEEGARIAAAIDRIKAGESECKKSS